MATGTILSIGQETLVNRGIFTGDINDTDIADGIYYIGAASGYTHADFDDGGITVPNYCVFISFKTSYAHVQLFVTNPLIVRKQTGSPSKWRTYQFDSDKTYVRP